MRLAIIGDETEKEGGTRQIIKHIIRTLDDGELKFEYFNSEIFFPKYIPRKWKVSLISCTYVEYLGLTSQNLTLL